MGSIQTAMSAMGYQSAQQRPGCGNCYHGKARSADRALSSASTGVRCSKGGFLVSAFAICAQHQPWQPPAAAKENA